MPQRPPQPAWMPAREVQLSTLVQNVIGWAAPYYTGADAEHRRKWTFMDSLSKLPGHDDHNTLTKMCEEVGVDAIQELLKLLGEPPAKGRRGAVTATHCAISLSSASMNAKDMYPQHGFNSSCSYCKDNRCNKWWEGLKTCRCALTSHTTRRADWN